MRYGYHLEWLSKHTLLNYRDLSRIHLVRKSRNSRKSTYTSVTIFYKNDMLYSLNSYFCNAKEAQWRWNRKSLSFKLHQTRSKIWILKFPNFWSLVRWWTENFMQENAWKLQTKRVETHIKWFWEVKKCSRGWCSSRMYRKPVEDTRN